MPKGKIRPYELKDREAIRQICFETGFMGEPADFYWTDMESFADMWSSYYTDHEPESVLVAEVDNEVVGYLLGCLDSKKAYNPVKIGARYAFLGGGLLNSGTRPVLLRTVRDTVADLISRKSPLTGPFDDPRWPSHLHIDFLKKGRGLGLGREIMTTWLERLRSKGSPGCHLETLAENHSAIAFFKTMGFELFGEPQLAPGIRSPKGVRVHGQVMVQTL